ncbi:MAG TPA: class I SAM-dependent methyltransferase [Terriglobia bacterium]|nr:class I SAM-dependent methyltransferase [Terriglobia bacterium]
MSKKHLQTTQKQFTKTAEAFIKQHPRDTAEMLAERAGFAKPQAEDLSLDVACGGGTLVLALAPRVRRAFGIDLTPAMLGHAREFQKEKQIQNAAFACGQAERLPFADGAFDLVTCQFSLHHMQKPQDALREMLRVTRAQGRIMVVDTLGPESDEKWELHQEIEVWRDPSHIGSLRLTTFITGFEALGLEVIRQRISRRERSFNSWMLRAGLDSSERRYVEARRLLESSMPGDRAGFSPKSDGEDILITHNEGMFLLTRHAAS